jgi:hypothetical protein
MQLHSRNLARSRHLSSDLQRDHRADRINRVSTAPTVLLGIRRHCPEVIAREGRDASGILIVQLSMLLPRSTIWGSLASITLRPSTLIAACRTDHHCRAMG